MRGVAHPRGEIATALTCVLQGFCQLMLIAARRLYDQWYYPWRMAMASIRKRNNRWEARVRRRGYPTHTKTFTHKSSAQVWAKETELDLETAHLKSVHFAKSPSLTGVNFTLFRCRQHHCSKSHTRSLSAHQWFSSLAQDLLTKATHNEL